MECSAQDYASPDIWEFASLNIRQKPATLAICALLATASVTAAQAQPAAILETAQRTATVESIDLQERTILLRGETGELETVRVPREVRNLPQLRPGDRVFLHVVSTVDAHVARPGDPLPESTTTAVRSAKGERPGGLIVSHNRMRVKVEGVNVASNSVSVIGADRVPRTFTLRQPTMRALLPTLKVGDEVDVTFTDAISLRVAPAGS